jgi:ABC-type glycerol-3-phosphate transport system substrate-binding protein
MKTKSCAGWMVLGMLMTIGTLPLFAGGSQNKGGGEVLTVVGLSAFQDPLRAVLDSGLYTGKVDFQLYPENELDAKIKLEMVSGAKTFDVGITNAGGSRQYGGMGILESLPRPSDYDDFFPGYRTQYSIGSTIYGYPVLADVGVMYYNRAFLGEAGYAGPPKTWDEFKKMVIHLTRDNKGLRADEPGFNPAQIAVYGLGYKGAAVISNVVEFMYYIYGNGGLFIANNYNNNTYNVTCDAPPMVSQLEMIVELNKKYHAIPDGFVNYDYDEVRAMLGEGRVAIMFDWPGAFAEVLRGSKEGSNIRMAALPAGAAGNGAPIGGWSVNVFKDSKYKDAALRFAQALSSHRGLKAFSEVNGTMPSRLSTMQEMTAEAKARDPILGEIHEAVMQAFQTGIEADLAMTGTASVDCLRTGSEVLNAVFAGLKSPKQALDELKVTLEGILIKNDYMK